MIEDTAATLIRLAQPKIRTAKIHTRGFRRVAEALGERVARWAYADLGDALGHRSMSHAETALRAWGPTIDDWCLALSGITGIGKTIAAARFVAERGGMLISAHEADDWGFGGGDALVEATEAEWLLIDDVGDEKTQVGAANLESLIAARDRHGARTVVTTTLTPALVSERGDHFASRLRPYFVVLSDTRDRRSKSPPFLRGISRQFELVQLAPEVQLISQGSGDGDRAETVRRFAKLAGVDLDGEDFALACETDRERVTEVDRLLRSAGLVGA